MFDYSSFRLKFWNIAQYLALRIYASSISMIIAKLMHSRIRLFVKQMYNRICQKNYNYSDYNCTCHENRGRKGKAFLYTLHLSCSPIISDHRLITLSKSQNNDKWKFHYTV